MKTITIIFGFLIIGLTSYSQSIGSIGGVELPDSTVFTSELNNALEDSLQDNRDRDDALYLQKSDTSDLASDADVALKLAKTDTSTLSTRIDLKADQTAIDSLVGNNKMSNALDTLQAEASATALDDIGDPDAATTIGLDDGETITINSAEDAGTVLTINMTDADAGGNIFGIDLIHAGDANTFYRFMRCYDNTSDLQFDISSNGNVTTAGTIVAGSWIRCDYGDIMSRKIHDTPATTPAFNFQKARDGTPTDDVSDEDYLGEINFRGYHTDEYSKGATIRAIVDDTPGEDDMPSRLEFLTSSDGSDAPAVRLTIDAIGNAIFTDTVKADKDVKIAGESVLDMFDLKADFSDIGDTAIDLRTYMGNNYLPSDLVSIVYISGKGNVGFANGGDTVIFYIPYADRIEASTLFPEITTNAGDTTGVAPGKAGDIFIDTSASKVYISKGTDRGDWLILNWFIPLLFIWRKRWFDLV